MDGAWTVIKYILGMIVKIFLARIYLSKSQFVQLNPRSIVGHVIRHDMKYVTEITTGFYYIKGCGIVYIVIPKDGGALDSQNQNEVTLMGYSKTYYEALLWIPRGKAKSVISIINSVPPEKKEEEMPISASVKVEVDKIIRWAKSRKWFKDRGILHSYGVLLYGPPGGGKTTLVRMISNRVPYAICVLDLSSAKKFHEKVNSDGLSGIWLIEDIDTIFHGRTNVSGSSDPLDFGTLLNTIQGVSTLSGSRLLFITTNHPEHLDPALANYNGGDVIVRPGRIDAAVYVGPLDEGARRVVVQKTIPDRPDLWADIVAAGEGETIALFQARCTRIALDLFWSDRSVCDTA